MNFVPFQFTSLLFFSFCVEERKLIVLGRSYGIILSRVDGCGLVLVLIQAAKQTLIEYFTHLL